MIDRVFGPVPTFPISAFPRTWSVIITSYAPNRGRHHRRSRPTARLQLVANFLRLVPGIVAVAGLPVVIKLLQGIPFALYVEVVAAAVCVLLYLYGRWRLPSLVSILMLGLHFAFWFWGTARVIWYWPVYPLIGFCSAVVWGIYVKQSEQSTNPRSRVEAKFA